MRSETWLLPALVLLAPVASIAAPPLQVYILAGQSNMQGHAKVETLQHLAMDPDSAPLRRLLVDAEGAPRVADRVWISSLSNDGVRSGRLTAGFGADEGKIGPEFSFGMKLAAHREGPILLIKTAWGGKSLHTDFRPPSAGPYEFSSEQVERLRQQGKDLDEVAAEKATATGQYYRLMLAHVQEVLADLDSVCPGYQATADFELAGFVWFQGWNDMVDSGTYPKRGEPGGYRRYSEWLATFIRDLRRDLETPELPFVIGVLGVNGPVSDCGPDQQRYAATHRHFRQAMAAPADQPEFQSNVFVVRTEDCWDAELGRLVTEREKLKGEVRREVKEGGLSRAQAEALMEERLAQGFSERDLVLLSVGVSNAAYHYLGSAKILGGIGCAFAESLLERR